MQGLRISRNDMSLYLWTPKTLNVVVFSVNKVNKIRMILAAIICCCPLILCSCSVSFFVLQVYFIGLFRCACCSNDYFLSTILCALCKTNLAENHCKYSLWVYCVEELWEFKLTLNCHRSNEPIKMPGDYFYYIPKI